MLQRCQNPNAICSLTDEEICRYVCKPRTELRSECTALQRVGIRVARQLALKLLAPCRAGLCAVPLPCALLRHDALRCASLQLNHLCAACSMTSFQRNHSDAKGQLQMAAPNARCHLVLTTSNNGSVLSTRRQRSRAIASGRLTLRPPRLSTAAVLRWSWAQPRGTVPIVVVGCQCCAKLLPIVVRPH